jgi:biopolymer transport protein ExbD
MSERPLHAMDYATVSHLPRPLGIFDLAPLIDVLLMLVIFALMASGFVFPFGVRIDLPEVADADVLRGAACTLTVTREERIFLKDPGRAPAEQALPLDTEALRSNLGEFQRGNPDGIVVINADVDVRHGHLLQVLEIVRDSGLRHIAFGSALSTPAQ